MNTSSPPPDDLVPDRAQGAVAPGSPAPSEKKRPIVWMIVTGVAVVAVIGLALYAANVSSDLDATQSELAAQEASAQTAEAEAAAQAEAAAAAAAEVAQINADNEVFVVSNEDVATAESEVAAAEKAAAEASSSVSTAQDEASKLRAELDQARAERDLARAEGEQARICARGSLGAILAIGEGDADSASELETVSSACTASVSG